MCIRDRFCNVHHRAERNCLFPEKKSKNLKISGPENPNVPPVIAQHVAYTIQTWNKMWILRNIRTYKHWYQANVLKQHLKHSILMQESRSTKTFRDDLLGPARSRERVQPPGNEAPVPVPQVSVCVFVCVCFCLLFQFSFFTFYIRNLIKQSFKLKQGLKLLFSLTGSW